MDSRKDFRDVPSQDIRLPREVYYRCLWTVRDSGRLEQLAEMISGSDDSSAGSEPANNNMCCQFSADSALVSEETCRRAMSDLACIRLAAERIPDVYREGLLDNIREKTPFPDFAHPNTWKRWKLVFMYELAKALSLI